MKKMSIFGMLALLVLSFASVAQAADIKASGKWQIDSYWNNSMNFETMNKDQTFRIEQRIRTAFQFIANENLKAVLDTQIGSNNWGNGLYQVSAGRTPNSTVGGANSAGNGNIMLRQGYIDFKWPDTKVNFKVGFQTLSLPAAFGGGSAIFDDQAGAAVVSAPINDNFKILAGYVRPYDANNFGSTSAVQGTGTSGDVAFAAVPIDFKGFNITPFGAFMYAGRQAAGSVDGGATSTIGLSSAGASLSDGARAYWAGAAFTMTAFEPFKVMADFNYGSATYNNYTLANPEDGGRKGWLFDVAVDYTGLSMMTPEVYFVYASGNKNNTDRDGRMPVMGNPQSWSVNNSFYFGDRNMITGFNTASSGGSNGAGTRNTMGFWTAGFALKDIKLIDNLSHTFNVMYIKGTNDADGVTRASNRRATGINAGYGVYLTDKDSLIEVDLQNKYKIYDALSLQLDLGYINADIDKDTWRAVNANYGNDDMLTKNAYRVALGLSYSF